MRFLIFSPYFAPHVGGVESFVAELNQALLAGHGAAGITVLAPLLPRTAPAVEDIEPRYSVLRYPAVELIANYPVPKLWHPSFWRVLRAATPTRQDVLVSHTRFFISSALALLVAKLSGRPLLHVEHGSDYVQLSSRASGALARAYDHTLGHLVLRHADAVVAVSNAAAEFVRQLAKRECQVIYRGFLPQRIQNVSADVGVLKQACGRTVVTYVGRLIDGKGVADLIRAFADLGADSVVLCIVGDGPRRRDLELLAERLGIKDRVLFLGYVHEARVLAIILASDVVVNPSYTEGLPTTVLEAALLGRPILATDVGGTRELVTNGQTGVLVPARDVPALARELELLLGNPELRRRLGRSAQSETKEKFLWAKSAASFYGTASHLLAAQPEARNQST